MKGGQQKLLKPLQSAKHDLTNVVVLKSLNFAPCLFHGKQRRCFSAFFSQETSPTDSPLLGFRLETTKWKLEGFFSELFHSLQQKMSDKSFRGQMNTFD